MQKTIPRCVLWLSACMLSMIPTSDALGQEHDIINKLKAFDDVHLNMFSAQGTVFVSFEAGDLKERTIDWSYTIIGGRRAIQEIEPTPTYQKEVADGNDYGGTFSIDSDGRMQVIAESEAVFLFDHDLCGEATTHAATSVTPNNTTKVTDKSYSVWQYPPDSTKNLYYVLRLDLTMGRGFSQYIRTIESVTEDQTAEGERALRVSALGQCISPQDGRWNLLIEPEKSFLVREASFSIEGVPHTLFSLSNSGIFRNGDLLVAKQGRFQIGPDEIAAYYDVKIDSASPKPDHDLILRVRNRIIDDIPNHAFVEDQRLDPPRTYRINTKGAIVGDSDASATFTPPAAFDDDANKHRLWLLIAVNAAFILLLIVAVAIKKLRSIESE